jgi:DNA-binding transcriptional ArsR family regulator
MGSPRPKHGSTFLWRVAVAAVSPSRREPVTTEKPNLKPYQDITDPTVAKALAHPLRTRILAALEDRTASPSELATELEVPLGVLSYHVRRLTALGFLKLVKRVPRRGAVEHYYTATVRPRITDEAWGSTPAVVKRSTLSAALDQVGSTVTAAAAAGGFDAEESRLTRAVLNIDEQGWLEVARELEKTAERIREIENESRDRLTAASHDGQKPAAVVMMLFQSPPNAPGASGSAPGAEPKGRGTSKRRPSAKS